MAPKTIVIVRHGETEYNAAGRWQGWLPTSLNATGQVQARALAAYFRDHPVGEIYSSDLKRAYDTAQAVAAALALPITTDERLREINVGVLQDLDDAQVQARYPEELRRWRDDWGYVIPQGESRYQQQARAHAAFAAIRARATAEQVLIVTHGGIVRTLMAKLFPDQTPDLRVPNASITMLDCREPAPRLVAWGVTDHLR